MTEVKIKSPSKKGSLNSYYLIRPSKLEGTIYISGAKNSVLRLMAASILTNEKVNLKNYPSSLLDAKVQVGMLEELGKECLVQGDEIVIHEPQSLSSKLNWEGRSIRNTLLVLGALVTRTGAGCVPLPGGCQIGERKFDLHEMILRQMGAEVWIENNQLCAQSNQRLKGSEIHLPIRSTGATENAIICGCLAEGITRVWNPHIRPEIIDLINYLKTMGAKIKVFGQEHIEIIGVEGLTGTQYTVIPDNMEAITWMIGSVITGGDLEIFGFPYEHLEVPLIHLRESGARFYQGTESIIIRGGSCYPVEISTAPYPGINSDMQPLFAVYAACARGESRIIDLRFPGRYGYIHELAKLGVQYDLEGNLLRIKGGNKLKGAEVKALDLRAGVALTLAALVAEDETKITNSWQIERGYNQFVSKLQSLGATLQTNIN